MKKLSKRTFALLLSLALLAAVFPVPSLPAAAEISGDYEYSIIDETAKTCYITGYTGSGGNVVIPSTLNGYTVTLIGYEAFRDRTSLACVTIGNSVKTIGDNAFWDCTSLTSVTIPNSVTEIGRGAFEDTAYYNNSANWTGDVLYLGKWLIETKNTLSGAYEIKSGTVGIADGAFENRKSLTSVTIPNSVTTIGSDAFSGCKSLTSVTIGNSVTTIGGYAFRDCASLTSVTIPDSVTEIGGYAFRGCTSLTSVTIPDSVTSIDRYAFEGCTSLTSVTIPDSVTEIGILAFCRCTSLTSVTIPDSVTKIGKWTFGYCTSLTSVTIPDSVTKIGSSAFEDCTSLTSVTIGNGVTEIGGSAFCDCTSLKDVYYTGTEAQWQAIYIDSNNQPLLDATRHYNSSGPDGGQPAGKLRCEPSPMVLSVGETKQLNFYIGDELVNDKVEIRSDNPEISISETLMVTGLAEGAAFMLVSIEEPTWCTANCLIYVGEPNVLNYTASHDTHYFYADGGFFSEFSSMSDCVEIYCLLENKIAEVLKYSVMQEDYADYFTDIAPITLTAEVSGSDLSFDRNTYQNTYTTTFDAIAPDHAVDDLLMLFPHNIKIAPSGNSYTVKVTLQSESFGTMTESYDFKLEDLKTKRANEDLAFINGNAEYRISKNNYYGEAAATLKNDADYKWSKFIALDFENYHEVVFADIMIKILDAGQVKLPSLVPKVLKDWVGTYKTLLGGFTTIVKDDYTGALDISETKIDKLLKKSKYIEDSIHTDDDLYQLVVCGFGKVDNIEKINNVFAKIDKTNQVKGFVKFGVNIVKDIIEWGNKISLFNTFSDASDEFKNVMRKFEETIPNSEWEMKEAVNDYINYSAGTGGQIEELLESFSDMLTDVTLEMYSSCIGKSLTRFIGIQVLEWVGTLKLASGALLSSTAAFATAQSVLGGVIAGTGLGMGLSDALCKSTEKAKEMGKTVAMAEYAPYIIDTLNHYEANLVSLRTDTAAVEFEYAFALHQAAQSYLLEHSAKAVEAQGYSIVSLFTNDDYAGLVADILAAKKCIDKMECHPGGKGPSTVSTTSKIIIVRCPTDVCVRDASGNVVAKIVDNNKEILAEGIDAIIMENEKYIILPTDQEYTVEIVATGEGVMEYRVAEYEGAQCTGVVKDTDIPLTNNKVYTGTVPEKMDVEPESYALQSFFLGDANGDGVADNMDAAMILQYDAGLIGATNALLAAGDVTGDGAVDNMDAAKILQYDAGLISSL